MSSKMAKVVVELDESGTRESFKKLASIVNDEAKKIQDVTIKFKAGEFDGIVGQLTEIKELVQTISAKDLGINLSLSTNAKSSIKEVNSYKQQIIEVQQGLTSAFSVLSSANNALNGRGKNVWSENATAVDGLRQKISGLVTELSQLALSGKLSTDIGGLDQSKLNSYASAYGQIAEKIKSLFSEFNTATGANIDTSKLFTPELSNNAASAAEKIATTLDDVTTNANKSQQSVTGLQESLNNINFDYSKIEEITNKIYQYFDELANKISERFLNVSTQIADSIANIANTINTTPVSTSSTSGGSSGSKALDAQQIANATSAQGELTTEIEKYINGADEATVVTKKYKDELSQTETIVRTVIDADGNIVSATKSVSTAMETSQKEYAAVAKEQDEYLKKQNQVANAQLDMQNAQKNFGTKSDTYTTASARYAQLIKELDEAKTKYEEVYNAASQANQVILDIRYNKKLSSDQYVTNLSASKSSDAATAKSNADALKQEKKAYADAKIEQDSYLAKLNQIAKARLDMQNADKNSDTYATAKARYDQLVSEVGSVQKAYEAAYQAVTKADQAMLDTRFNEKLDSNLYNTNLSSAKSNDAASAKATAEAVKQEGQAYKNAQGLQDLYLSKLNQIAKARLDMDNADKNSDAYATAKARYDQLISEVGSVKKAYDAAYQSVNQMRQALLDTRFNEKLDNNLYSTNLSSAKSNDAAAAKAAAEAAKQEDQAYKKAEIALDNVIKKENELAKAKLDMQAADKQYGQNSDTYKTASDRCAELTKEVAKAKTEYNALYQAVNSANQAMLDTRYNEKSGSNTYATDMSSANAKDAAAAKAAAEAEATRKKNIQEVETEYDKLIQLINKTSQIEAYQAKSDPQSKAYATRAARLSVLYDEQDQLVTSIEALLQKYNLEATDIEKTTSLYEALAEAIFRVNSAKSAASDAQDKSSAKSIEADNYKKAVEAQKEYLSTLKQVDEAFIKMQTSEQGSADYTKAKAEHDALLQKVVQLEAAYNKLYAAANKMNQTKLNESMAAGMDKLINSSETQKIAAMNEKYEELVQTVQRLNSERMKAATNTPGAQTEVDALTIKYNTLKAALEQVAAALGVDISKINNATNAYNQFTAGEEKAAAAAREFAARGLISGDAKIEEYTNKISTLRNQLETLLTNYSGARSTGSYQTLVGLKDKLNDLEANVKSGTMTVDQFKRSYDNLKSTMNGSATAIKNSGMGFKSFTDQLKSIKSTVASYFSVSRLVYSAISSITSGIKAAIELQDTLVDLQIVTGKSSSELADYASSLSQTAQEIGSSMEDLITASTTYARLGYSLEDSSTLAKYTTMLEKVGDIEASDAQDAVTAILKAFPDETDVDNISTVMDKMVAVGNNFPISVSQIAEGMNNASSVLAAAGNSYEESVALLAAANTTIQDASKSSTGLRTITARLRNTTTDLEELGETDFTAAKYEELVKALTDQNVALTDINGEYRSTYDIMKDIAAQWDNMTSMEQSAMATAIAGTRQQAVFYSLIENFDDVAQGSVEAMTDSGGYMTDSYSEYLDTITAHTETLTAAFQGVSTEIINELTPAINSMLDVATGVINTISELLGGINALLEETGMSAEQTGYVWMLALSGVLAAINPVLGIAGAAVVAISAIVQIVDELNVSLDEQHELVESLTDEYEEMTGDGSEYDTLINREGELTEQEKARLEVLKQIIAAKEEEIRLAKQEEVDKFQQEYADQIYAENVYSENDPSIVTGIRTYSKLSLILADTANAINDVNAQYYDGQISQDEYVSGMREVLTANEDLYNQIIDLRDNAGMELSKEESDFVDMYESIATVTSELSDTIEEKSKIIAKYGSLENYEKESKASNLVKQYEEAKEAVEEYAEAIRSATSIDNVYELQNAHLSAAETMQELYEQIETYAEEAGLTAEEYMERFSDSCSDTKKKMLDLTAAQKKQSASVDKLRTAFYKGEVSALALSSAENKLKQTERELAEATKAYETEAAEIAKQKHKEQIESLVSLEDELEKATAKLDAYDAAMEGGEKDDGAVRYNDAWDAAIEDIEAGKNDSNTVHRAVELFLDEDARRQLGYDTEKEAEALHTTFYQKVFGAADSDGNDIDEFGATFASYLNDVKDQIPDDILKVESVGDGIEITYSSIEELAGAISDLNGGVPISVEMLTELLNAMDEFGGQSIVGTTDLAALAEEIGIFEGSTVTAEEAFEDLVEQMHEGGSSEEEISSMVQSLNEYLNDIDSDVNFDEIITSSEALGDAIYAIVHASDEAKEEADAAFSEIAQQIGAVEGTAQTADGALQLLINNLVTEGASVDEAADAISKFNEYLQFHPEVGFDFSEALGDLDTLKGTIQETKDAADNGTELKLSYDEASSGLDTATQLLETYIATYATTPIESKLTANIDGITSQLTNATNSINSFIATNSVKKVFIGLTYGWSGLATGTLKRRASGTLRKGLADAPGTLGKYGTEPVNSPDTLVGELGPEMVVSGNQYRIVGQRGAEFTDIRKGDIVFDAEDTKKLLQGKSGVRGQALVNGTGEARSQATVPLDALTGSGSSSSSSSGSGDSDSSSTNDEDNWFKWQYDQYKHLIEMDQATSEEFLAWLKDAWPQAYAEGLIEYSDAYSYEEEVYQGMKDQFDDWLNDQEFAIDLAQKQGATADETAASYQNLADATKAQIDAAHAQGLTDDNDWVQSLWDKYYEYIEAAKDAEDELADTRNDNFDDYLNDKEFEIELLKDQGAATETLIPLYQHLADATKAEIEALYAQGLTDNDDRIQELWKKYYGYVEDVKDAEDELAQERNDNFDDYLNDKEFEIELMEDQGKTAADTIPIYQELADATKSEIEALYAQGLTDNDDRVQELWRKYYEYVGDIKDAEDETVENSKDAVDDLVRYRMKMIEKDCENQKDALSEQLSDLKDFVDKQKSLLQDQADEEDYLEQQAEYRKAVSDLETQIAQLQYDDSSWAQKRRLELQEELADAKKELEDFEEDHALDEALDALDDTYDKAEEAINKQEELIDDYLDDQESIYNDALADVQEGSDDLYNQMVAYAKKYSDGTGEEVVDMWNESYDALKDYYDLNNELYKDINLSDATGEHGGERIAPVVNSASTYNEAKSDAGDILKDVSGEVSESIQNVTDSLDNNSGDAEYDSQIGSELSGVLPGANNIGDQSDLLDAYSEALSGAMEDVFTSSDGTVYKMLSGVEDTLTTQMTDLVYSFANAGSSAIQSLMDSTQEYAEKIGGTDGGQTNTITLGDIVINGSASEATVSEIRRAQRENVNEMLKKLASLK